jgi:hypothetical protein
MLQVKNITSLIVELKIIKMSKYGSTTEAVPVV